MDRLQAAPFEADILVDSQFFQIFRSDYLSQPERALLFAVLNEAVETFQKFASSKSVRKPRVFCETESWMWDDATDSIFTFRSICELLGLDPVYVRHGLREAQRRIDNSTVVKAKLRCRQTTSRKRSIHA